MYSNLYMIGSIILILVLRFFQKDLSFNTYLLGSISMGIFCLILAVEDLSSKIKKQEGDMK